MKLYEILDVPPEATEEQIKAAYRILVQLHHPDRLQQVSAAVRAYAEERLKKINQAYHELSDPERRARYDATWQSARARQAAGFDVDVDAAGYDDAPEWGVPRRRRAPRRPKTAREREAEAAYEAWAHQEAERYAAAREAERNRRAADEARAAEARARRAAEEQYPRARLQGSGLVVHFAPGVWTTLVHVPTGTFTMGSDSAADAEAGRAEQPAHAVRLSEYYLGQYPVTNAQYRAFLSATGREPGPALPAGRDQHPVVNVAWDEAAAFCQWLRRATGRMFRLPTEAEWEKAARGTDGRKYPWGNEWEADRLNGGAEANGAGAGGTTPVGAHSPAGDSPYGAADMAGNVWEWCHDWFDARLYARREKLRVSDPTGPATGQGYVARGGAFNSPARHTRCAHRNWFYPDTAREDLGFRVAAEG
jgi:formylglycine-generating enzyme required for sulfatase activity